MREPEKEQELTNQPLMLVTKLDVQQPDTIAAAIQEGIDQFGHIDALANNAGYGEFGIFESTAKAQVSTQFDVNVFGVMDTIRAIPPHFRERKQGMIINFSYLTGRSLTTFKRDFEKIFGNAPGRWLLEKNWRKLIFYSIKEGNRLQMYTWK